MGSFLSPKLLIALLLTAWAGHLAAAEPVIEKPAAKVDYVSQVKPIFTKRCVSCHGHLKQESGLRVDAARLLLKGGERGPAVVAGDAAKSVLLDAINGKNDLQMPPEGEPLTSAEIELITKWVNEGADAPAEEKVIEDPRKHWSFQKPVRPTIPVPKNAEWVHNPIDAFIAAGHDARGLTPVGAASKNLLLRRVSLNLTGLPPSPEELHAFLADESPDAYAKVVDRLLESPQYGERWARHWMDVWRYSDWYGYQAELRNSARHIWRWRDWIIESLNDDKPYDRMILEMLAADEMSPEDPSALRATGYLARSYYKFNRNVWLDNAIEHTSKAFLGVTMNCARCHDHMYDPITQKEYYEFRAIFEPYEVRTDAVPGEQNIEKDGLSRVYDAKPEEKTFLFIRGDEKSPEKEHPLAPGLPALFSAEFELQPVSLPAAARYPGLKPHVQNEMIAAAKTEIAKRLETVEKLRTSLPTGGADTTKSPAAAELAVAEKQLAAAESNLKSLEARIAADRAKYATPSAANAAALAEAAVQAQRAAELLAAEAEDAAAEFKLAQAKSTFKENDATSKAAVAAAEKGRKEAAEKLEKAKTATADLKTYAMLSPEYPATSTGRRTALAKFIIDRSNPLTARVAVNHIWLRHFGQPLVPTVFDFGLNGKTPSHPELLDWLAVELMDNGWSMKHIHRLIVLSNAYRMESATSEASPNVAADPDNIYLWRMNSRRAESEVVRDSVLAVSGQLDRTRGGPELDSDLGQSTFRRSIYYRHAPEKFMTFLRLFDSANTTECYQRRPTVVPQQALAMVNSPLSVEQARRIAATISEQVGREPTDENNDKFVLVLFERLLCRSPSEAELSTCREFLSAQGARLADPSKLTKFTTGDETKLKGAADPNQRARENLAHVLLNHHEFVTIR